MADYKRTTNTSKPGGRPKANPLEARSQAVAVRLTELEKHDLTRMAMEVGLSPSDYVRRCVFGRRVPSPKGGTDPALISELNRLTRELSRVGNNANQLARATHRDSAFQEFWQQIGQEVRFTALQARKALETVLGE